MYVPRESKRRRRVAVVTESYLVYCGRSSTSPSFSTSPSTPYPPISSLSRRRAGTRTPLDIITRSYEMSLPFHDKPVIFELIFRIDFRGFFRLLSLRPLIFWPDTTLLLNTPRPRAPAKDFRKTRNEDGVALLCKRAGAKGRSSRSPKIIAWWGAMKLE